MCSLLLGQAQVVLCQAGGAGSTVTSTQPYIVAGSLITLRYTHLISSSMFFQVEKTSTI